MKSKKDEKEVLPLEGGARTIDDLNIVIDRVKTAQEVLATYSQEQVDKIFAAMALAANDARIPLAKMAVEETGMGVVEVGFVVGITPAITPTGSASFV